MSELLSEKIELEDKLCQAQQDLQHLENKLQVQEVEFDVCIQTKWSIHERPEANRSVASPPRWVVSPGEVALPHKNLPGLSATVLHTVKP